MSHPDPRPFRDRTAGLVLFGVLQIALGVACALIVPAMVALIALGDEIAPEAGTTDLRSALPSLSFYLILAVMFVGLGVGSIRARRWSRTLSLMVAWIWLVTGVISMVLLVWMWPSMLALIEAQVPLDDGGVVAVVMAAVFGLSAVLYVALPGVLVLFYRGEDVRATCEHRHPEPDWTDRCPPAVLALALSHVLLAYSFVFLAPHHWAIPFFGTVLTGFLALAVVLPTVAANLWIAVAMYRLRPASWWGGLAMVVALTAASMVTFVRIDVLDYYDAAGLPPEQIEAVTVMGMADTRIVHAVLIVFAVAYVAYLFRIRRHFPGPAV